MEQQKQNLDALYPSIFDEEDNVYNTSPLEGDLRPSARARKAKSECATRTDTPARRRMS